MYEYDICTYLCLTLSYLQRINYLERKKKQPKGRKIILVQDKTSKVWAFSFQNLAKCDDRNIEQPKFTTDCSILFTTVILTTHY